MITIGSMTTNKITTRIEHFMVSLNQKEYQMNDHEKGKGRGSQFYKNWRNAVLKRDHFQCTMCKSEKNLHAHHIIPWKINIEKRFEVSNGRTLCCSCHLSLEMKGKTPWNIGMSTSNETKKKIRDSLKGRTPWNKGLYGLKSPMEGKKHKEETKSKMSASRLGKSAYWNKGLTRSEETKKKISESKKGQEPPNKGKIKIYPDKMICKICEIEKEINLFPRKDHWYELTCRECKNLIKREKRRIK